MPIEVFSGKRTQSGSFVDVTFTRGRVKPALCLPAVIENCVFEGCRFEHQCNFRRVRFRNCEFRDCILGTGGWIYLRKGTEVLGCSFSGCSFRLWASECHFMDVIINRSDFADVLVMDSSFINFRAECAIERFSGVRCKWEHTDFTGSNPTGDFNVDRRFFDFRFPDGDNFVIAPIGLLESMLDEVLPLLKNEEERDTVSRRKRLILLPDTYMAYNYSFIAKWFTRSQWRDVLNLLRDKRNTLGLEIDRKQNLRT